MATEIEIHPLSKPDIPAAVECIQKAFSDDPAFRWLFDDPDKVCICIMIYTYRGHDIWG